jgi:hypothetical protein
MNQDSMNNEIISIDHISSEQHLHVDNQINDIKSKEIEQRKKSSMIPTPLYVSFFYFLIIIQIFH